MNRVHSTYYLALSYLFSNNIDLVSCLLIEKQVGEDVRVKYTTFLLIVPWGWCSGDRVQGDCDDDGEEKQKHFG